MDTKKYEAVIGLEVHVQLKTRSKAFCGCANEFGATENTNVCPVCLGLPGALPVLNGAALKSALKVGLALGAAVNPYTKFDRKNYFYPDLPKNFQISQYDLPLCEEGHLDISSDGGTKRIRIKRVHLEEDAGKLIHPGGASFTFVDYNRAGVPLLEIVSEPDLRTPDEAHVYLTELKLLLRYLDISDCDMEKGSLRCDANVSLRPMGETVLGTKTELKNMNSFKAVRLGLEYEIRRQSALLLEEGGRVIQETRLWNEERGVTLSMRSKEEAHDYRYFPEPDLPPFTFTAKEIEAFREGLPELPQARRRRFADRLGLSARDASVLVSSKDLADFFEECLSLLPDPKKVANWLMGPVLFHLGEKNATPSGLGLSAPHLTRLISLVEDGTLSHLAAKDVLAAMVESGEAPDDIVRDKNLIQLSSKDALSAIIEEVIVKNERSVNDYLAGKEGAIMFLVGQVMKSSQGKANPKVARDLLGERLKK